MQSRPLISAHKLPIPIIRPLRYRRVRNLGEVASISLFGEPSMGRRDLGRISGRLLRPT